MPKMTFDNEMSGVLFVNKEPTSANSPDLRGSLQINGKKYWVSAWNRSSRGGTRYITLAITDPDSRPPRQVKPQPVADHASAAAADTSLDFDKDIPF